MKMRRRIKNTLCCLAACFFVAGSFSQAIAAGESTGLKIERQTLSADIRDISLKAILTQLAAESGLWFKCEAPVLEKKITVKFSDLSTEDGLKRILANVNHSLVYEKDGKPVGVYVVENGLPATGLQLIESISKTGIPEELKISNKPEIVEIKKNVSLPGGVSYAPGERELFSQKEEPGGPELFMVKKNVGPPGGLSFAPGEQELFFKESIPAEPELELINTKKIPSPTTANSIDPKTQLQSLPSTQTSSDQGNNETNQNQLQSFRPIKGIPHVLER